MTTHPNRSRRFWMEGDVVCLRDEDMMGETITRQFWAPPGGGCIREIRGRQHGILGQEVCSCLAATGYTLSATPDTLLDVIKTEYRRAVAQRARENRY